MPKDGIYKFLVYQDGKLEIMGHISIKDGALSFPTFADEYSIGQFKAGPLNKRDVERFEQMMSANNNSRYVIKKV